MHFRKFFLLIVFLLCVVSVSAQEKNEKKQNPKKELTAEEKREIADKNRADWIEKTMRFGTHKERKQALSYIEDVRDDGRKQKLIKLLLEMLEKENESTVIIKSIHVLGDLEEKGAVPLIKNYLYHDSEDVRIAAVYFIKDVKAESVKPDLIKLLKEADFEKDSNFTIGLIKTLGDFKAAEIKDFAIEKIEDNKTTHNNRMALVLFLGESGASDSEDFLIKLFKDEGENSSLRSYAVSALSKLKSKKAADSLTDFMKEYDSYSFNKQKKYYKLYMYTLTGLVRLGDDRAFSRLYDSLRSDNSSIRLQAINLLKELGDKRSIDILKYKAEYDPNIKVQKAAKDALKEMGIDLDDESEKKDSDDKDEKTEK